MTATTPVERPPVGDPWAALVGPRPSARLGAHRRRRANSVGLRRRRRRRIWLRTGPPARRRDRLRPGRPGGRTPGGRRGALAPTGGPGACPTRRPAPAGAGRGRRPPGVLRHGARGAGADPVAGRCRSPGEWRCWPGSGSTAPPGPGAACPPGCFPGSSISARRRRICGRRSVPWPGRGGDGWPAITTGGLGGRRTGRRPARGSSSASPLQPGPNAPALLEAVRNADPARGRGLLARQLGERTGRRAGDLLAGLAAGLSDDDEPFLEAALDDRSAGVRQVAVDLLGRLPSSRRAARMAERLRPPGHDRRVPRAAALAVDRPRAPGRRRPP